MSRNSDTLRRGRPPVFPRVYSSLRDFILDEALPDNYRLPSIAQLCRKYGVSRTAVRKAVTKLEAEGVVIVRGGKGIYVKRDETRRPVTDLNSFAISFVTPEINDPFPAAVQTGLSEALRRRGRGRLVVESADWVISRELDIVRRLPNSGTSGAVIIPTSGESLRPEIASLCDSEWPLVLVDRRFDGVRADFVGVDHVQGAKLAVSYLIGLGHRRIGIIRPVGYSGEERYMGYRKALEGAQLVEEPTLVVQLTPTDEDMEPHMVVGSAEMNQLLALAEPPTAIFAGNDHIALGAFWAVQRAGLKVPEDISIIGFDGLGVEKMVPGGISTVRQPGREIGREAGKILLEQIMAKPGGPLSTREIHMQAELILGATTAHQA